MPENRAVAGKTITWANSENRFFSQCRYVELVLMLKMRVKHMSNFIQAASLFLANTFLNRTIQSRKSALHLHVILKETVWTKVWWKCGCFEPLGTDRQACLTHTYMEDVSASGFCHCSWPYLFLPLHFLALFTLAALSHLLCVIFPAHGLTKSNKDSPKPAKTVPVEPGGTCCKTRGS